MEHSVPLEVWAEVATITLVLLFVYTGLRKVIGLFREAFEQQDRQRAEGLELRQRQAELRAMELDVREKDLLGKQEVYNRRHAAREAEKEKEAQELAALDELERLKALRRS